MKETQLAETRSVDDQALWQDDHTVLYGLDNAVWAVPADGSGAPRKLAGERRVAGRHRLTQDVVICGMRAAMRWSSASSETPWKSWRGV